MYALVAVFGKGPEGDEGTKVLKQMVADALIDVPDELECSGQVGARALVQDTPPGSPPYDLPPPETPHRKQPLSQRDREASSLGAMGAAQWTGRFRTRPHALLDVRPFDSVDDWIKTLPRGNAIKLTVVNDKL